MSFETMMKAQRQGRIDRLKEVTKDPEGALREILNMSFNKHVPQEVKMSIAALHFFYYLPVSKRKDYSKGCASLSTVGPEVWDEVPDMILQVISKNKDLEKSVIDICCFMRATLEMFDN